MRNTVIWSFLSLMALATGGLVTGCDSDAKIAKSSAGESCARTSDCNDGLRCLDGTCYKTGTSSGGSANNEGGDGTGATVTGPPAPVLGGEGESCTRRADCEDGLACLSQRCTQDATGGGGEGNVVGPLLGAQGETCTVTSDCQKGLACRPGTTEFNAGLAVCTPIDTDLQPTGKRCDAECVEAADCCELPVALHATLGAYSCSDLAALVADVANCDTATGLSGHICLAYNSYCDDQCGANTWSCDAGKCSYAAKCTKTTPVVGGCPQYTRGGHAISACDVKTTKCVTAPIEVAGCTTDAKCDAGLPVADAVGDTCSPGECACQKETGACYRKCSESQDCPVTYKCDDTSALCVPVGSCTTDAQCVDATGDVRFTCVNGACMPPACEHDIDCNPFGLIDGHFINVCGPDGTCVELGCTSSDECDVYDPGSLTAGGVRAFCGETVAIETVAAPVSAITD
jgi:hypothetical protein